MVVKAPKEVFLMKQMRARDLPNILTGHER